MAPRNPKTITLGKVPGKGDYSEGARLERLDFLARQTGIELAQLGQIGFASEQVSKNIESLIGSVEIPVGVAGPLQVNGRHAQGVFYGPLATTEGALLASVSRGATALSLAGGVNVACIGERMMRVPCFELGSLAQAQCFMEFVMGQMATLQSQVANVSRRAQLVALEPQLIGRTVYVQFVYETAEAAGQNMTTSCTWTLANYLRSAFCKQYGLSTLDYFIDSNLSSDKKASFQSFIRGRGVRVVAECEVPGKVVQDVLRISPERMVKTFNRAVCGAIAGGVLGVNANIANTIAALFTATGQDIACVHESAVGHLNLELGDGGALYASLVLPSLVIGTVGGGTGLAQQQECLQLLGCVGEHSKRKLGEIIAGFCLGLELSTLAAVAADQFAQAHDRLGRNRPQG